LNGCREIGKEEQKMTVTYAHRQWSPIGAIELKASYRKNMTIAVIFIISAIALSVGAVATVQALAPEVPTVPKDTIFVDVTHLLPPPLTNKPPISIAPPTLPPPSIDVTGIMPIDDDSVSTDFTLLTRDQLESINAQGPNIGGDSLVMAISVPIPAGEILPDTGVFVPFDEEPVAISLPTPKYPEMARIVGIEGKVYVEVLIDTRGKVCGARIIKDSGANAGFEEAALEAAWKGEWRPAMQNKQPVAVRVSYPVVFKLK
jgi:TonB family protein